MLYVSNDRTKLQPRYLFLSGLHVFNDGRPDFSENSIAAEGALDLGRHRQLVCCQSRSAIDAFVEQPAGISLTHRWLL